MNIVLAFCAGTDMQAIVDDPIGQPMATVINIGFYVSEIFKLISCRLFSGLSETGDP